MNVQHIITEPPAHQQRIRKSLIYTVAWDHPNLSYYRQMAILMAASARRSGWGGDIIIYHNGAEEEMKGDAPAYKKYLLGDNNLPQEKERMTWHRVRFGVRDSMDFSIYDRVFYLEPWSLITGDLAKLFEGEWDIACCPVPGSRIQQPEYSGYLLPGERASLRQPGCTHGMWGVRGELFTSIMAYWDALDAAMPQTGDRGDAQSAWNRLLLDPDLKVMPVAPGTVAFPFLNIPEGADNAQVGEVSAQWFFAAWLDAVILNCDGLEAMNRMVAMMYGLYSARFFDGQIPPINKL